jgi:site-specific DNA recombinase
MRRSERRVWHLLEEPERLEQEYHRRLQDPQQPQEPEGLDAQMGKLRRGIARLIDSYAEGFIDKQEFEPRVTRMRDRLQHLEEQLHRLKEEAEGEEALRVILGRLETFAAKVNEGLHQADFQTRREIIRALVKRVEIAEQQIRVVFRISPLAPAPPFEGASPNWQHWGRREHPRRFHGDVRDLESSEPIGESEQIHRHSRKRPNVLLHFPRGYHDHYTSDNGLFVDIQSTTALMDHLHAYCSFWPVSTFSR